MRYLVGGLEHGFYDFPYIGNHNPNWRTHIFQRGRYTTNQLDIVKTWTSYFFRLFIEKENLSAGFLLTSRNVISGIWFSSLLRSGRCSPGAFPGGGCGVPEDVAGGKNLAKHGNLVGGLEHFLCSIIYGMSSFPLTFIFFRGVGIPPPRGIQWTFNGSLWDIKCPLMGLLMGSLMGSLMGFKYGH